MEILADNRIDFGPSICTVPEEVGIEAAKSVMAIETPLSTRGKLISISCGSQAIQVQVKMVTSADGTLLTFVEKESGRDPIVCNNLR